MSVEIQDRCHLQVAFNPADGGIVSQSGNVQSVVRTGVGVYEVTHVEGIGFRSACESLMGSYLDGEGPARGWAVVQQDSTTLHTVRTFNAAGVAEDFDRPVFLTVYMARQENN